MTTTANTTHSREKMQNWTRHGFSVPSSRQCAEPETTETREKIHIVIINASGTEQSENPTHTKSRSQKQTTLPQHHLQLTSTRRKTNALNMLIRFVVPLEIMSTVIALIVATPREKPHDKHHSSQLENEKHMPTRKLQNANRFSNTTSWPMFHEALH